MSYVLTHIEQIFIKNRLQVIIICDIIFLASSVKKLLLTTQQGAHLNLDLTASNLLEMMSCSLVHFFCAMRRRERLAASIYRSQQRVPDRRSNRPQTSCPDKNTHTCMYINRFSRISIGFVCVVMQMCAELQNKKMPVHNEPQIRVGRTNKPL